MVGLIKDKLTAKGLKVTPQRIAILQAIYELDNHPTAEMILEYVRELQPGISNGTVYKVLDTLLDNGLVQKVKTEKDFMRYDGIMESHHHLYCSETEDIRDYSNEELDNMLKEYFEKNNIKDFEIEDIKLQINGRFKRRDHE